MRPLHLPTDGFKWLTEKQIEKIDLSKYTETSNKGSILEVDLEYPGSLHELHNDYPLPAEKIKLNENMLSIYSKNIQEKYNT